MGQLMVKIF